jgi:hypothetical protein
MPPELTPTRRSGGGGQRQGQLAELQTGLGPRTKRTGFDGNVGDVAPADLKLALPAAGDLEDGDRARGGHGRRRTESTPFRDGAVDEDADECGTGFRRRDVATAGLDEVGEDALRSGDKVRRPVVLLGQGEVVAVPGQVDFERGRRVLLFRVAQDDDRLAWLGRLGDALVLAVFGDGVGREGDQDVALDGGGQDAEPAVVDVFACTRSIVIVSNKLGGKFLFLGLVSLTDYVDPARRPRDLLDGSAILALELFKDLVPALAFVHECGGRVDLVERVDERQRGRLHRDGAGGSGRACVGRGRSARCFCWATRSVCCSRCAGLILSIFCQVVRVTKRGQANDGERDRGQLTATWHSATGWGNPTRWQSPLGSGV